MEANIKGKIEYSLRKAKIDDISLLIKYKLSTILKYAKNLSKDELKQIEDYVNDRIPKDIFNYQLVIVNDKVVGCILVSDYEDGKLLDEIYLEDDYRNKGIGSRLINDVLNNNEIVYLWVYKDNKEAIDLYSRLGFLFYEETETRYKMVYYKE